MNRSRFLLIVGLVALASLGGCARKGQLGGMGAEECLARAMYFESNRSSEEGMLAVGTVVMNRLESGRYPASVCGVVGQKNQFAPGVMTKPMGKGRDLAMTTARKVLRGQRHRAVEKAMFFHTAGYSYPYSNMHYLTIQGGNAFYEKRKNASVTQAMVAAKEGRVLRGPGLRTEAVAAAAPAAPRAQAAAVRVRPAAAPPAPDATSIEDLIRQSGG